MNEFQNHNCPVCGEQFIVACELQLREKLETHKSSCKVKKTNRKSERTMQLQRDRIALYVHGITVDRINQYNFDKLVNLGMLVNA